MAALGNYFFPSQERVQAIRYIESSRIFRGLVMEPGFIFMGIAIQARHVDFLEMAIQGPATFV